ncbi:5'-nucleotidase, lipoprotein e(P4) family [Companilactobacillus metriopterae]|uniref:5'-nucleotidase, lipoprotein e(P4) family n=1 Tax=Companilactobacillus metriopterae TaxID=1909267 RepID=UPI001F508FFB|nr:5'-nucleotidase, lipoprotein e(P4) family [Companilactobacillus metriopterae]
MKKIKTFALMSTALIAMTFAPITNVAQASTDTDNIGTENIMSVAWFQTSSEARALYYQGYNTATNNMRNKLAQPSDKPYAVVLDIDETVLDNSPYQAYALKNNVSYPTNWHNWILSAQAKALPGVKNFLNLANANGVSIFYVSDRSKSTETDATIKNLTEQGLPQADTDHVLLKSDGESGKSARRSQVESQYNVIEYIGDNLTDFNDPETNSIDGRNDDVNTDSTYFGDKYIILPNPMYGG